jgi:hypothetical protein
MSKSKGLKCNWMEYRKGTGNRHRLSLGFEQLQYVSLMELDFLHVMQNVLLPFSEIFKKRTAYMKAKGA